MFLSGHPKFLNPKSNLVFLVLSLLFVWIPNITITTITVHYIYIYCSLGSSIISLTGNNPDLSVDEPSFCDVHRAVPLHENAHDLQVALQPQSQLWKSIDFPDIFGHDPMVDFPHLRFTIGSKMCWCYVCYVLFEGILAVQIWQPHGDVLERNTLWLQHAMQDC